ncbi:MAG: ATP synthase subunit C [Lentisphaeria bacterium]|nr:ATP synthase subunit C [Lentisphaeria bacterium]
MTIIKSSCFASYTFSGLLALILFFSAAGKVYAADGDGVADDSGRVAEEVTAAAGDSKAMIALAAALTMACSCIAAGYAVAKVGAAAMGAASEKPEIMGKAMLFVAIAEGIAIYGLIIAVFILTKI